MSAITQIKDVIHTGDGNLEQMALSILASVVTNSNGRRRLRET